MGLRFRPVDTSFYDLFTESANQHVPFLLRKAEKIEEYLQQR